MATNGHSKNFQIPKANHPWRNYRVRFDLDGKEEESQPNLPSLLNFLKQIVEHWETYTVPDDLGDNYTKLKVMQPKKQAEWLAAFIHKTWMGRDTAYFLDV